MFGRRAARTVVVVWRVWCVGRGCLRGRAVGSDAGPLLEQLR